MMKHRLRRVESLLNHSAGHEPRPAPRRLQTVQDVIELLQEQVEAVRAAPWVGTLDRARTIAALAGVARKAIESGTLAARIEMLETVLKLRAGDGR
jgi:hypothetical protein